MFSFLLMIHPFLIYGFLALLFLAVGSLLNVVIYRLPLMLQAQLRQDCAILLNTELPQEKINLFFPRSFCPQCKAMVKAWQNLPLLSYLFLKGRCYQCHVRISLRYPLVELLTVCLSLYACWHFGFNLKLVFSLSAIWLLIALMAIDWETQLLPDNLTYSLLWLGLIANTQDLFVPLPNAVLSTVFAYLSLWLFIQLFYLIRGKIGMGHGDFKLFAALGAWFGWIFLPLILIFACCLGLCFGLIHLRLTKQSQDTPIPFGPFLGLSGLMVLFWGQSLLKGLISRLI